jgi:hypothetical protein
LALEADSSPVERVDQKVLGGPAIPDQKVTGKVYTFERKIEAPANFEQNDTEGDGESDAPIQDIVDERVPRIVVRFPIPAQALPFEQRMDQLPKDDWRGSLVVEPVLHRLGQSIESKHVALYGELWILLLSDVKGSPPELEVAL